MSNTATATKHKLGWIGTGRMGAALAERLLAAGCDLAVTNRTRAKAEALAGKGAKVVDRPVDLADRDIVFATVNTEHDLDDVLFGAGGLATGARKPKTVVDLSTISVPGSARLREKLDAAGVQFLCAPVSGNAKVIKAGKLTAVASGPREAFDAAAPYLLILGKGASYAGTAEEARIVKICHNVMLGITAQTLAEMTVLAEKYGIPRHAFLDFMNNSVLGSTFTRYKTPALVNLDFTVTFTPTLLLKDMDLGLAAAKNKGVPVPTTATVREVLQGLVSEGEERDFATLMLQTARASGLKQTPENVKVDDGLH